MTKSPVSGRFVLDPSPLYLNNTTMAVPEPSVCKKVKNPYPKPTWVVYGEDEAFGGGYDCRFCGKQPFVGDLLLVCTVPQEQGMLLWAWFVMHEHCLQEMLVGAPRESFTAIKARLESGGALFDDDERAGGERI